MAFVESKLLNSQTRHSTFAGPAGTLEIAIDAPPGGSERVAIIAHPHPLFGGTMDNKVVQTLARAFVQSGWTAVRFNFRGVGASAGVHDEGRGELEDLLAVVAHAAPAAPAASAATANGKPVTLALAGFSFGAFVTTHAFERLSATRAIDKLVLVGTSVTRAPAAPIAPEAHARTLVVHGEQDDTVLLAAVLDWARPQTLPVTVIPGVGHFFHGQLPLLKNLVLRHLAAPLA